MASHKTRQLQQIFRDYEKAGFPLPAATKDVADWAIRTGRWRAPASIEVSVCAREIARAIREDYITDDQGKRVRVKHSVMTRRGEESLHLWHDMRRAERGHMELAFAQRRAQIIGDCHQLHTDVGWYNGQHPNTPEIQLVLDFTDDVAELNAAIAAGRLIPQRIPFDGEGSASGDNDGPSNSRPSVRFRPSIEPRRPRHSRKPSD
jgi:hypothetical protein